MPTIGFIGTGNMGGALARAAAKNADNRVLLFNRTQSKAEALAKEIGAEALALETLVKEADFLFLGVKPQMLPGLEIERRSQPINESSRRNVSIL